MCVSCSNSEKLETEEPQTFDLLTISRQDYVLNTEFPASIQGYQDIKIFPRVEGYLQDVYVKEGEQVTEGQLLFRLENASYRAVVESAEANVQMATAALEKSKLEYNGKQTLHDKEIISDFELSLAENDLGVAKANLMAAKASLNSAKCDLNYTEIVSPSNGVVGKIPYRKGTLVGPSMQDGLTVVADNSRMRVYFSMSEKTIMQYISTFKSLSETVKNMPELRLQLSDGEFYDLQGRVESISGIVDEKTGAVSVCALFENPNSELLSGSTGKIIIPQILHNAIVIPQQAVCEIQDKTYVVKVVDNQSVSTMIQVNPSNDGKSFVVTDGLSDGDVIIAKGAGFVKDGTNINTNQL